MRELRHILYGLNDPRRMIELAEYFDSQAAEARMMASAAQRSIERAAELAQRLAAYRASRAPSRLARDIKIMQLARRGRHGRVDAPA